MAGLLALSGAAQALLSIDNATWDGRRNLTVQGTGDRNDTVTVVNAYNTNLVLGTDEVGRRGDWSVRSRNPNPVPCAVSARAQGDPLTGPFPVANAPADCAPKPPVQNNPPVCAIDAPATNVTITVGGSVNYTSTVTDADGDPLTISWTFNGGTPASSSVEDPGAVSYNTAGSFTTTLTASDGQASCAPQSRTITVEPVQQQVCNIAVTPTTLAFGDVNVGTSAARSTTVSNSGTAACSVTLVRTGSNDFAITSATSFNVAPGASSTVSVSYTPGQVGPDTGNVAFNSNDPDSATVNVTLSGNGVQQQVNCVPANLNRSINSTSQDGCPDATVPQQTVVNNATSAYSVLAINDLGMHCGDLDTRIASILPPFQVLLAQVVQKTPAGSTANPVLNPAGVSVFYSAAANPNDPVLASNLFDGEMANGDTYKTNFWDFPVPAGTYDAFYPAFNPFNPAQTLTPLAGAPFNVTADTGLPVPNVEDLYIGPDGVVNSGDEFLSAVLHAMPGIAGPYTVNDPKLAQEHYLDKPFFVNFPFGYVAAEVNWYEGAGIPFAAFDDNGRENAYPLVRVQARTGVTPTNPAGTATVATVDTVLPISGEASCSNCHADPADVQNSRTAVPTTTLQNAGLPVVTSLEEPNPNLPTRVSVEWAADINVLRLHDLRHGARYVSTACDTAGENCLQTAADPCVISANDPDGSPSCLTNKALVQGQPVVCQVCHYTPALDLAQLGPLAGPTGTIANGRNQVAHQSNSRVMHNHHGSLPNNLFPPIPPAAQNPDGSISNQAARLAAMDEIETEIVAHEGGISAELAGKLVQVAQRSRNLKGHGLDEGMSTRLLVYAAQLIGKGIAPQAACQMALVTPLTDDPDMRDTLGAAVNTYF